MIGDSANSASVLTNPTFTRTLLLNLTTELQAVVGHAETREAVSFVGMAMGEAIEAEAAKAAKAPLNDAWSPDDLARVLVTLKSRIDGDFSIREVTPDEIVLENSRCPFGPDVKGRDALCMMTSSVFGGIAARHFGHAEVTVDEAIARGDAGCRVRVRLRPRDTRHGKWTTTYRATDTE